MTIPVADLMSQLRSLDIRLWAESDRLRYSAPADALTPELRAKLVERKADILAFLHQVDTAVRTEAPPIEAIPHSGDLPLSFAQQRLWFLDQLAPERPTYNLSNAFRLIGPLDVEALAQSLSEIVRRHEALRTTFEAKDGQPVQIIGPGPQPDEAWPLSLVDCRHLPETEREDEARRLAAEEARRPFILVQGPLLRVTLFQMGQADSILLLIMHHIISDGWSMGIFTRELAVLYEAYAAGQHPALPDPPIQYADFARWQRQWLQGSRLETQLAYWKQQLAGPLPSLQLPGDHPRPANQSFRGARHSLTLPTTLVNALRQINRQHDSTLFMMLLAAFNILLYRYSGQEDLIVGSPIANRNRSEIENLIGFFVNTLALRTDLSGNPTFLELLARLRQMSLEAYAHQDLPFERLVEALQPERDLSHQPIFQVMFVHQNTPLSMLEFSGLTLTPWPIETGAAKFDLTLFIEEDGTDLRASFEYSTDLFNAATISRLADHFQTLLAGIAARPESRLAELPLLTDRERQQLLVTWNATQAEWAPDRAAESIQQVFEAQVWQTPDARAAVFNGRTLTYDELNRRTNQLAHHLRALGVGPDKRVGICLERSLDMAVALVGVLKSGGAYLPLDPRLPPERLAFMLADAQAVALLTHQELAQTLPDPAAQVIRLDADATIIARHSDENPAHETRAENLAYILFTSGSTGQPKAVAVEHRHLLNYVYGILERLELPPGASFGLISAFAADLGNTAIFPSLCSGGCLHLILEEQATDPEALAEYGRQQRLDCLKIVPSHLKALLTASEPGHILPQQRLILGGEASDWAFIEQLHHLAPDCVIINHYGPTETTVGVTTYRVEAGQPVEASTTLPLGRPLANTQIYLLDPYLQPVPIGVPGELYVGGQGVSRGYLNRPALTAERFIPDPFSPKPGARLYRTGDRARYLPDGNIEFLGRVDHQVKIRGFRVELGEIEAVLGQHPAVREAAVLAQENPQRLVAYIVPRRNLTEPELLSYLKESIPDYMLPSVFVFLDSLPLNKNGKVDRRALPAPDPGQSQVTDHYQVPRDPVETVLADLWANLLGLERVGIFDNFFELGGHSLLAIQLISRLYKTFQVRLPVRVLFEAATIASLSEQLVKHEGQPGQVAAAARLRQKIRQMPAEEVQALLQARNKAKATGE